ncbi:isopentenyl-diphosphate delta-isomerase [Halobacteriales archaeon QH_6_68_27]|nr:MAG: isopentenyl-diphosphate delta-isomerase [Halobacteriales archaeon QH_6_68_27]
MSTEEAGQAESAPGEAESAEDHPNAAQSVVLVDENDEEQGLMNRLDAHTGDGTRHRAFTSLLFDQEGNILLAQRSPEKRLWDTFWDGTVEATRERLAEELGVTPDQYEDLRVTDRFEYKRYYYDEGVEHEVCAVLKATLHDRTLDPDPEEVAGLMWVPYERLHEHPRWYRQLRLCPWFEVAMRRDFD